MAITVQNSGNPFTGVQTNQASNLPVTASVTVAAGTNRVMVIEVQGEGNGVEDDTTITSITVNGSSVGVTQVAHISSPSWGWTDMWFLIAPPTGTYNVVANTNIADLKTIKVYVFDGANQTMPVGVGISGFLSRAFVDQQLFGAAPGDFILDSINIDGTGHFASANGSGGTAEIVENTGHSGGSQCYPANGTGDDTCGWTWSTAAPVAYIGAIVYQYVEPPQILYPDSDVTTTGWTTTPLWSKVDEASAGGDVIVGTHAASGGFGSSPLVVGLTEGALSSAGANVAITLPSGGSSTDLYIVIIAKGATANTVNALAGWTEVLDENAATGLFVAYYTGAGVPSNPTFVQSASSRSAWAAYRISEADKTIAPQVGTTATGTSTTPDPPSVTVTGGPKNVLAFACFSRGGEIADDDSLVSAFPTGYNSSQIEKSAGTVGTNLAGIIGSAAGQFANVSSVNPGTFTIVSGAWRAQTIVVHPLPSTITSVAELGLSNPAAAPAVQANHKIKVRARLVSGSGTLSIALYQGGTLIATVSQLMTGALANYTLSFADSLADDITDYTNLRFRFWDDSPNGSAGNCEIDQLSLEIPAAAPGGGAIPQAMPATVTLGAAMTLVKKAPRLMAVTETMTLTMAPVKKAPRTISVTETMGVVMLNPKKASIQVALFEFLTGAMTAIKKKPVALAANLTFTGNISMIRTIKQAISAGLTLTPAVVKKMIRPMPVTETLTPTMTRIMTAPRPMAATLTLTGALTAVKKYGRAVAATLTLTAAMTPKQLKIQSLPVTLTLTPTMARVMTAPRLLAVTVTMAISVVKKNPRTLAVTETLTAAMVRVVSYPRAVAATLTLNGAISLRQIRPKALAANLTLTPTMQRIKLNLISFPVTMTLTAAMASLKKTGRNLAANLTLTPTMARVMKAPRLLAASLTLTPAMIRKYAMLIQLNVPLTVNVAVAKKFLRSLATGITLTPTMGNKQLQLRALAANLTLTAALTRVKTAPRLLAASETLTGALSKRPRLVRNVNLNLTAGSTMKSTSKISLPASLTLAPEMIRRYFVKFIASLPLVGDMSNTEGFTQISFNVTLNLVAKMNAFRATLGRVWLYAASTPSRIWGALSKPKLIDTVTDTTIIDTSETKPRLHDVE